MATHVIGDLGRYATALYGASAILQDNPEVDKAVYAGIGFAVASVIKYISDAGTSLTDSQEIQNRISNLESKLKE